MIQPPSKRQPELCLTYAQLNRFANQVAGELIERGVGSDTPVGLALPKTTNMLVALLGILKAGGGYLPLDPAYPAERLDFMVADSGIEFVLTEQEIWDEAAWGRGVTPIFLGDLSQFAIHSDQNRDIADTPDRLALSDLYLRLDRPSQRGHDQPSLCG